MVGLQTMPRRNFTNGRPWTKRFGDNPRLHLIGPLPIAPPSPATCEKLQWSVHGETPALTSTHAGSHGRREDGRWGRNTAYELSGLTQRPWRKCQHPAQSDPDPLLRGRAAHPRRLLLGFRTARTGRVAAISGGRHHACL